MPLKYRIKYSKQAKPLVIDFNSPDINISDLKNKIKEELKDIGYPNLTEENRLCLSLNGKDPFQVEDSSPVSSLGLVPGDTVYVIGLPEPPEKKAKISESKNPSRGNQLLSECPEDEVPEALKKLFEENWNLKNEKENIMAVLFHILMLESGFIPENDKLDFFRNWQKGTLRLKYRSSLPPHDTCSLVLVTMGMILLAHGTSDIVKRTFSFSADPSVFILSGQRVKLKNLRNLSLQFKNSLAYPLLVCMQQDSAEGKLPPSFLGLPPEIVFLILRKLDVTSIGKLAQCSRTCQQYADNPLLWKSVFMRDFKVTQVIRETANPNWKKLYKEEKARRNVKITCIVPYIPEPILPGPFPVLPPVYEPPRGVFPPMVGGDFDLYPNLMGLEPPRRRNLPNARPPSFPGFGLGSSIFRHF